MKIIYASERPPYPFFLGGAARCAHLLLQHLSQRADIESIGVGSADYRISPWSYPNESDYGPLQIRSVSRDGVIDCGYPVQVIPNFYDEFDRVIDAFKPDIIWSQLEGGLDILKHAKNCGIQSLYYVHDAEFDPNELKEIAGLDCHLVCSSGFLSNKIFRTIGRPAHVVYPAAELYFDTEGDPNGYITMINPFNVKGLPTFIEIAKRLPKQQFLLLESWKLNDESLINLQNQLTELSNVTFMRRVSDMRAVYRQTKLLLAPSIWEEGFGMVALEAQSCKIPVIASKRGGLPEAVGKGGVIIDDYSNPEAWIEAIESVISDNDRYCHLSDCAFRHASDKQFSPASLAEKLFDICSGPPPVTNQFRQTWNRLRFDFEKIPFLGRFLFKV